MKKILLLLTVAIAALSLQAAPIDKNAAAKVAKNYLANEMYAGKMMAPAALNPVLLKAEMSDNVKHTNPVYYIYNTSTTFLVIAGDDRAEVVLMVGDSPLADINNLPPAMIDVLSHYKKQISFLFDNPKLQVQKESQMRTKLGAVTYGPLLTCNWDQSAPYYNQCKFTYNNRTYQCVTGCPATSASMVLYYWKYPASVGAIASYTSTLDIGTYYSNEVNFTYPGLSGTSFDWGNMRDSYLSGYNSAQGTAVATLMRYVGQAEQMMYGVSGSGIYTTQSQIIATMFKNFGYDSNTRLANKSSYSTTNWANLIIGEMAAGRPVVYLGVDNSAGGHAFNVDGYRDSDSKYHINFGWSGQGNNWCAMNAFSDGDGYTFNQTQQAIVGIMPPGGQVTQPALTVNPTSLAFETSPGGTVTKTFTVNAENLYADVTITKGGNSYFTVSPTTLTKEQAMAGATVTVTYNPAVMGNHVGTITVASSGATSQTVSLTGTAASATPVVNASVTSLSFSTQVGAPVTKTFYVTASDLTGNVSVSTAGAAFSASPAVIMKGNTALATTGVEVTVTYDPSTMGNHTGTITIASSGAESKTVSLTGTATAPSCYIDVSPSSLSLNTSVGQTVTKTLTVTGVNLNGPLELEMDDGYGYFDVTPTTLTKEQAAAGATVTISYNPSYTGTHTASLYISGGGAADKSVNITGTATAPVSTITATPTTLNFSTQTGTQATQTFVVNGQNLTGNISLVLSDPNGVYSFSPSTITAAQAANGVTVTVNYNPTLFGSHNATISIAGGGANPVTVSLNGVAALEKYVPVMQPANEALIALTQFRADWTDATPDANVTSYTLEVSPKAVEPAEPVLLHSLSGSAYPNSYADITLSAPWASLNVRGGNNAIYIKNNYLGVAQGYITYTVPEGYTNATFTVMVSSINNSNGVGDVTISTPQTAAVSHNFVRNETFYWLVTASSGEKITIISNDASYSPDMSLIAVYSGDATPATLMASETGDANHRLIEGITEKFYTVKDLAEAGTFLYRVKALYTDGSESDWSNIEEVTLFNNAHPYPLGDVDHSTNVDINDVTVMIEYVLKGGDICFVCGDLNGDEKVDINDVTTLIGWVLTGVPTQIATPMMPAFER